MQIDVCYLIFDKLVLLQNSVRLSDYRTLHEVKLDFESCSYRSSESAYIFLGLFGIFFMFLFTMCDCIEIFDFYFHSPRKSFTGS